MYIFPIDKVEVLHCTVGSVYDKRAWMDWWVSGNWSTFSDSHKCLSLSWLSSHLCQTFEVRWIIILQSMRFEFLCGCPRGLDAVSSPTGEPGNGRQKEAKQINSPLFPKMRFLFATLLENLPVANEHAVSCGSGWSSSHVTAEHLPLPHFLSHSLPLLWARTTQMC